MRSFGRFWRGMSRARVRRPNPPLQPTSGVELSWSSETLVSAARG